MRPRLNAFPKLAVSTEPPLLSDFSSTAAKLALCVASRLGQYNKPSAAHHTMLPLTTNQDTLIKHMHAFVTTWNDSSLLMSMIEITKHSRVK